MSASERSRNPRMQSFLGQVKRRVQPVLRALRANSELLATALVAFVLILLPDLVFQIAGYQTSSVMRRGSVLLAAFLALALVSIESRRYRFAALAGIVLSQVLWFGCLAYFGRPLGPEQVLLAGNEAADVTSGIIDGWRTLLPPIALVLVNGVLLYLVVRREFATPTLRNAIGGWLLALVIVTMTTYWMVHKRVVVTIPGERTLAATGPYQALVSATRLLLTPVAAKEGMVVVDQVITPVPVEEEPITIVVIMGEGISPARLPYFGFNAETSPRLSAWAKSPPPGFELITKTGISGGVSTFGSVPAFIKMAYWPVDAEWRGVNLFELAHRSGFKSWFLSAQSRHFLDVAGGARGAEGVVTENGNVQRLVRQHDDMLVDLARELPADAKRRFVFFHQRVNHSKYTVHCSHVEQPERAGLYRFKAPNGSGEEMRRASYDNGLLCWDRNIARISESFMSAPGAVHVLITSDHGEMMGEHGLWGHSQSDLRVAEVPMLLLTNRPKSDLARRFRELEIPDWYQLSQLVARSLGHDVKTPGASDNRFYLNTTMPFGRSGYFEVTRTKDARTFWVRRYSREGQLQSKEMVALPERTTRASAGPATQ